MRQNITDNENRKDAPPIAVGLLAHVDAGKTTLAEGMLYVCGKLRKMGRVDHQDAFLDTYALEKQRGITIFSKMAQLFLGTQRVTLLDTPGHVDFSPETERTLRVLDYCILVISGADGVQAHVRTLWKLLALYQVPVFVFVNKMDQDGCEKDALMRELKACLSDACTDFSVQDAAFFEAAATGSEEALEQYLQTGRVREDVIRDLIASRQIFPCFFGSALKLTGVAEFLEGLGTWMRPAMYPAAFGARVFKIARDERGERLTYLKITGGSLKVKTALPSAGGTSEKINQIRIYDGAGYETTEEAGAGSICALTGPVRTRCGDGLGFETVQADAQMVPVLSYRVILPEESDVHAAVRSFRMLEEEEPQLHVDWREETGELHVRVMGAVQIEILKHLVQERFGLEVFFGAGSIIYKETIRNAVEGVGHFEPLGHYAEVHLLLEALPRGSGLVFARDCSTDRLALNWQRLILTHLREKPHRGVLTGSELTDVKITLKSGRAHLKHTEGGDFRQATYRAVRQGLMQAESVLLEPFHAFRLEVPSEQTGRAMSDLQRMGGSFEPVQTSGEMAVLTGKAPVRRLQDYAMEVISYTRGRGRLSCSFCGYEECRDADEIIAGIGYDPLRDTENPAESVFCSHGSGIIVPWDEVPSRMHLPSVLMKQTEEVPAGGARGTRTSSEKDTYGAADRELKDIFERTYGSGTFSRSYAGTACTAGRRSGNNDGKHSAARTADSAGSAAAGQRSGGVRGAAQAPDPVRRADPAAQKAKEQYLLVDGYNIIFAWDELHALAEESAEAARGRLMDILCNYQGYRGMTLILVFDAYRVEENPGEAFSYHNIHVVYTKEAETADAYIEKTVHRIGRKYDVTVATSDRLEQVIILGQGAKRMSAAELYREIEEMTLELRQEYLDRFPHSGRYLFDALSPETAALLEEIRLGKA